MHISRSVVMLSTLALLAAGCAVAAAPEKALTLQYRTARDAVAPSRFVALIGDGMTTGLILVWELPAPGDENQKRVQREQKEAFDRLLEVLEARQINGVEFECTGRLDGIELRLTTVPRLSESGLRRMQSEAVGRAGGR